MGGTGTLESGDSVSLLSLVPWYYRLGAIALLGIALFGYGYFKGLEHGEDKLAVCQNLVSTQNAAVAQFKKDGDRRVAAGQQALKDRQGRVKQLQAQLSALQATQPSKSCEDAVKAIRQNLRVGK